MSHHLLHLHRLPQLPAREAYSVSFTFFRSVRRLATSALRTSAASERVRVSTFWNSPRLSVVEASSLPGGGGLGREVRGWWDMMAAAFRGAIESRAERVGLRECEEISVWAMRRCVGGLCGERMLWTKKSSWKNEADESSRLELHTVDSTYLVLCLMRFSGAALLQALHTALEPVHSLPVPSGVRPRQYLR